VLGTLNPGKGSCTLLPGVYDVTFGNAAWKDVRVEAGKTTRLVPGVLQLGEASRATIFDAAGNEVARLNAGMGQAPVPPGDYRVVVDGKTVSVRMASGEKRSVP
jgi:hypothetical protein